jgi:hypothetical protein
LWTSIELFRAQEDPLSDRLEGLQSQAMVVAARATRQRRRAVGVVAFLPKQILYRLVKSYRIKLMKPSRNAAARPPSRRRCPTRWICWGLAAGVPEPKTGQECPAPNRLFCCK